MTEQEASNLLSQSGLNHGMVDAEYQPARWMFEAVIAAVAAEREACLSAAIDAQKYGKGIVDAIRERSNKTKLTLPPKAVTVQRRG